MKLETSTNRQELQKFTKKLSVYLIFSFIIDFKDSERFITELLIGLSNSWNQSSIKIVKMPFCVQYFDKMAVTYFLNAAAVINLFNRYIFRKHMSLIFFRFFPLLATPKTANHKLTGFYCFWGCQQKKIRKICFQKRHRLKKESDLQRH